MAKKPKKKEFSPEDRPLFGSELPAECICPKSPCPVHCGGQKDD